MAATQLSDPNAEIDRFKKRLEALYALVEEGVRLPYPTATFTNTTTVEVNEERTGPYKVPSLEISIPGMPGVRLVPRGIYMIGARGRVDVRSRLGKQILVWVEAGGPVVQTSVRVGDEPAESTSRPVFKGVPEGWAWTNERRVELIHLTANVFADRVLPELLA